MVARITTELPQNAFASLYNQVLALFYVEEKLQQLESIPRTGIEIEENEGSSIQKHYVRFNARAPRLREELLEPLFSNLERELHIGIDKLIKTQASNEHLENKSVAFE